MMQDLSVLFCFFFNFYNIFNLFNRSKMLPAHWIVPEWRKVWSHRKWKWRMQVSNQMMKCCNKWCLRWSPPPSSVSTCWNYVICSRGLKLAVAVQVQCTVILILESVFCQKEKGPRIPLFIPAFWAGSAPSNRRPSSFFWAGVLL